MRLILNDHSVHIGLNGSMADNSTSFSFFFLITSSNWLILMYLVYKTNENAYVCYPPPSFIGRDTFICFQVITMHRVWPQIYYLWYYFLWSFNVKSCVKGLAHFHVHHSIFHLSNLKGKKLGTGLYGVVYASNKTVGCFIIFARSLYLFVSY